MAEDNLSWLGKSTEKRAGLEDRYQYESLPSPDSIRLLTLKAGKILDELEGELHIVKIGRMPKYDALSYMWGDPASTTTIKCSGKPLFISANLGIALRRFRHKYKRYTIWADAVCINQADVLERNQQVPLMKDIYTKAEHVLGWVGLDEKGDAEHAFGLMDGIDDFLTRHRATLSPEDLQTRAPELESKNPLRRDHLGWIALNALIQSPYFYRAWVQQELGLAKDAEICWGEQKISWDIVGRCMSYITDLEESVIRWGSMHPARITLTYGLFATDAKMRRMEGLPVDESDDKKFQSTPFWQVLSTSRSLHATDPRDLVFSLLSHPAATRSDGRPITTADYTKSVSEVYSDITAAILMEGDLDILSSVFHNDGSLGNSMPSWVPNFTHEEGFKKLGLCGYCSGTSVENIKLSVTVNDSRTVIKLKGVLLDIVDQCAPSFEEESFLCDESIQNTLLQTLDFVQQDGKRERYLDQSDVVISSLLLVAGRTGKSEAKWAEDHMDEHLANFYDYSTERALPHLVVSELLNEASTRNLPDGDRQQYHLDAQRTCKDSRLFRTKKGYLGNGPEMLEHGDVVCVVFGADVPFVLRPEGDHYLFLGDCYVHGVMRGEAVERWIGANPEKIEEVEFEIH